MTTINVNLLSYYEPHKSLSVEVSTLEANGHQLAPKMTVKSNKTGNTVEFKFLVANYNQDDELTDWLYVPVDPKAPVTKLTIWND
ncbi:hypothetical protein C4588_02155 [Candidatus Parcubacteria bacterium]|nr:MAG: hypothetical protein C4588_02155 [Candidatus Parcubacteria bacterium]